MIDENTVIYDNVTLGKGTVVETFCIIGISPSEKYHTTRIGDNSRIRAGTYIYEANSIGNNFATGNKANIRESNRIGDRVSIGTGSIIEHHTVIEDDVRIHSNVFIPEYTKLMKGSWLGPNCVLTNAVYPLSKDVKKHLVGPIIGQNAKIGAASTILPGVTIGENSLIGAGSVVTKDIPPNSVVVGNPGRVIKTIEELQGDPYSTNIKNNNSSSI